MPRARLFTLPGSGSLCAARVESGRRPSDCELGAHCGSIDNRGCRRSTSKEGSISPQAIPRHARIPGLPWRCVRGDRGQIERVTRGRRVSPDTQRPIARRRCRCLARGRRRRAVGRRGRGRPEALIAIPISLALQVVAQSTSVDVERRSPQATPDWTESLIAGQIAKRLGSCRPAGFGGCRASVRFLESHFSVPIPR